MSDEPIYVLHVYGFFNHGGAESMGMSLFQNVDRENVQFGFVVHGDKIGAFDSELIAEFFTAFAHNAKITLHIKKQRGKNAHHIAEACFKAVAVALRKALAKNERIGMPSTKGCL